jgi:hypothetical protein
MRTLRPSWPLPPLSLRRGAALLALAAACTPTDGGVRKGLPGVGGDTAAGGGGDGGGDGGDGGGHATLDADPAGFRYEEMQTVDLVLRGEAVEGGFELELVVQATSLPEGEDGAVRDLEEEVWAGRVVAE